MEIPPDWDPDGAVARMAFHFYRNATLVVVTIMTIMATLVVLILCFVSVAVHTTVVTVAFAYSFRAVVIIAAVSCSDVVLKLPCAGKLVVINLVTDVVSS